MERLRQVRPQLRRARGSAERKVCREASRDGALRLRQDKAVGLKYGGKDIEPKWRSGRAASRNRRQARRELASVLDAPRACRCRDCNQPSHGAPKYETCANRSYARSGFFRGIPVWDPSFTVFESAAGDTHGSFDTEAEAVTSLVFAGLYDDAEISGVLNRPGRVTPKGLPFNRDRVHKLLKRHGIPARVRKAGDSKAPVVGGARGVAANLGQRHHSLPLDPGGTDRSGIGRGRCTLPDPADRSLAATFLR